MPPTPRPPVERTPGTGWSGKASKVVVDATQRHVRVLERLGERLPDPERSEVGRVRDEAAVAHETAVRAFRGPSQNELQKARTDVKESFRQSQTSLSRMSAGMTKSDGRAVRDALQEITAQQDRALRGFDALLGSDGLVPASNRRPTPIW